MSFIFDRKMNYPIPGEKYCETEHEVEEDDYNFNNADINSKSYLVNLYKNLKNCNYFLNSLVSSERLDYVVISLFKDHRFSFGIKNFDSEFVFERVQFTCEDSHVIDYIDNEELPPKLIDVIETFDFKNIYYNGCIISQIRDYRQSSTNFFNSYFILLKPTSLSLFNDVKKIIGLTNETYTWSNSARLKLESKLIYLTSPKLCLEPNPSIGILSKKLSRKKLLFGNKLFQRLPRKRMKSSKILLNNNGDNRFGLLNLIEKRKPEKNNLKINNNSNSNNNNKKINKRKSSTSSHHHHSQIPVLANIKFKDVQKLSKTPQVSKSDDQQQQPLTTNEINRYEEYVLNIPETLIISKLTIFKRPFERIFYGNILNVNNNDNNKKLLKIFDDMFENKPSPNFYLGTELMKQIFIDQFIETFSDDGKKMTHITVTSYQNDEQSPKINKFIYSQSFESYRLWQEQNQQTLIKTKLNGLDVVQIVPKSPVLAAISKTDQNPETTSTNTNINTNIATGTVINNNIKPVVVVPVNSNNNDSISTVIPNTATATKIGPNQIVIKHSNLKLINAANFKNRSDGGESGGIQQQQQLSSSTATAIQHHPVVLNVSTTGHNGTQIPIRIPLSFSLQQLKTGQLALVPNTNATHTATNIVGVNHNGITGIATNIPSDSSPTPQSTASANVNLVLQGNNILAQAHSTGGASSESSKTTFKKDVYRMA